MKASRLSQMEAYISSREFVSLDELCRRFDRSKNTIRRDVAQLADAGAVEKVYGGVRPMPQEVKLFTPFQERSVKNREQKDKICAIAGRQVQNGDVIFIDSGSTPVGMIRHLARLQRVTVLTNNLFVVLECLEHPPINLITLGGQYSQKTASFSAYCSLENLERFNISKAFMAATGVSVEQGATNTSAEEFPIKQAIVRNAKTNYLLADSSKFDHSALLTYAQLRDFQYILTEQPLPEKYIEYFNRHNIHLLTK